MKNKFHSNDNDHVVGAIVDTVTGVVKTAKKVAEGGKKAITALGGYKISPGSHHRKLVAAILFLRSLGYSDEQIRSSPLRQVVDLYGSWPQSIYETVRDRTKNIPKILAEQNIMSYVKPEGNPSPDPRTPEDANSLTAITREIYGPEFPEYGKTLPKSPAELLVRFPPSGQQASTPTSMMQAIQETAQTAKPRADMLPNHDVDVAILKPLAPMMKSTLQDAGYIAPSNLEGLSLMFYQKIVTPSTMENSIDESIVDSILNFVGSVANRKKQGENLPPILDKIGELTLKVEGKIEDQAKKTGQFKLGEFITENVGLIFILFLIIFLLARKKITYL